MSALKQRSRAEPKGGRNVSLLDAEPAFAAAVPAAELETARRMLRLPAMSLPKGRWAPPVGLDGALALFVLDGLVLRDRTISAGDHLTLAGPGDVVDVRHLSAGLESWRVVRTASVAAIDARLLLAVRRWPNLVRVLTQLLFDAGDDQVALNHILRLARVESRLRAFFAHYAERWGRVTPAGHVVDLPFTHEVLGRLVGAKRPTVTLALNDLLHEGHLARDDRDRWLLPFAVDAGRQPADG